MIRPRNDTGISLVLIQLRTDLNSAKIISIF